MMLAHPQLESLFEFNSAKIRTLVIENPAFFREFLADIQLQSKGNSGKAVLSQNHEPISFSGYCELIDSILSFDINRKSLITRLMSRMEIISADETHYLQTVSLMSRLEQYLLELSMDLPCDISCSKMNLGTLIRAVGVSLSDDYEDGLERFLDYMEYTRELEHDKLFVYVNLRSFYPDEEIFRFFSSCLSHEFNVFLVDSSSRSLLPNEERITVDNDLCEF